MVEPSSPSKWYRLEYAPMSDLKNTHILEMPADHEADAVRNSIRNIPNLSGEHKR